MGITVKFFASLREQLGRGDDRVDTTSPITAEQVWTQVTDGKPIPPNTLIAVNMEYVKSDHPITDGDEVAFFPPVTGG